MVEEHNPGVPIEEPGPGPSPPSRPAPPPGEEKKGRYAEDNPDAAVNLAADTLIKTAGEIVDNRMKEPERNKQPAITVTISEDGDRYCALHGEDLQSGIAGFGGREADAILDFVYHWLDEVGTLPNIDLDFDQPAILTRVVKTLGSELVRMDREEERYLGFIEKKDSEIEAWKARAELLWQLLDDIDTLSDQLKPETSQFSPSQSAFYVQALDLAAKREDVLESNGQKLFIPGTMPPEPSPLVKKIASINIPLEPLAETKKQEE